MTLRPPEFKVELVDEEQPVDHLGPGEFDESSQVFDDMPKFSFEAGNPGGVNARILQNGVELDIYREEEKRFPGIIDTVEPVDDQQDSDIQVEGVHIGYKLMQARICDSYDFDEDGDPGTVRDAVTINPWKFIIFREPGGTLDVQGNLPALTGVRPDEVFQMLAGTKFISQIDLQDTRYFLPSTITDATNTKVTVWRDGQDGDVRPSFQFVRNGDNYVTGGTAETIPLVNGDKNIDEMGDISTVEVEAIGVYDGTHDLTVDVCRDAFEDTRTYSTVSLSREDNWNGTTFSRWTGTIDLSGGAEAAKNALAAKLGFTPDDGPTSTTSKIYYLRFDADTESDTGITEGTLDTYSNPVTFGDGGENWIETDLLTFTRLRAAERVRKMTESDANVNGSPHWDLWIDQDLQLHFTERRGEDITGHEYSFEEGNLDVVRHRFYGGDLAFQTVAYGAGSGTAQTRIVSKTEFSNGGLYDSDRDPDEGGDRNYRVMRFVDQNEQSATNLLRKARAFHKLHRDPIETFDVEIRSEHVRIFETGDGIQVVNLNTRTDDTLRVVRLTRKWGDGGIGEDLITTIGEPRDDFARSLRNAKEDTDTLTVRPQPNLGTVGLSGNGFIFDKDHFGVYPISIPEAQQVERVSLRVETAPWQAQARSVAGGHTHDIDSFSIDIPSLDVNGVTSGAGGANLVEDTSITRGLDMDSEDVGGQDMSSGTASGQNVNGDTGSNTPESQTMIDASQDQDAGQTHKFTTVNAPESLSGFEYYMINIHVDGDGSDPLTAFEFSCFIEDDSGNALDLEAYEVGSSSVASDLQVHLVVPIAWADDTLQNFDNLVMTITPDSGSEYTVFAKMEKIPTHNHNDGTLAGQSSGVSGNTGSKFVTDTGQTLASLVSDILGERRVGYRGTDGGVGTILYSEGGDDFHESHEHSVSGQTTIADTTVSGQQSTKESANLEIEYGIFQFDGDDGDGSGAPVYGKGIKLAVDPTVDANGVPTDFGNERVPVFFGSRTEPAQIEVDITPYLETDANGLIKTGPHKVFFKSEADGSVNSKGLAVVRATPVFEYKDQGA